MKALLSDDGKQIVVTQVGALKENFKAKNKILNFYDSTLQVSIDNNTDSFIITGEKDNPDADLSKTIKKVLAQSIEAFKEAKFANSLKNAYFKAVRPSNDRKIDLDSKKIKDVTDKMHLTSIIFHQAIDGNYQANMMEKQLSNAMESNKRLDKLIVGGKAKEIGKDTYQDDKDNILYRADIDFMEERQDAFLESYDKVVEILEKSGLTENFKSGNEDREKIKINGFQKNALSALVGDFDSSITEKTVSTAMVKAEEENNKYKAQFLNADKQDEESSKKARTTRNR